MNPELKARIRCEDLWEKVRSAREASSYVEKGMTLGVSGFTQSGYTKAVAAALAKRAEAGEDLQLTVYSGASLGDEFDGVLTRAGALKCRMPYQTNKDLRQAINEGKVKYVDIPLGVMPGWVRNGYLNHIDIALVEAAAITEEGNIIPTTSVGATDTYVKCADKVIIEINTSVPASLEGIHDIYTPEPATNTQPIPIVKAGDRIGTTYIPCDPKKIVAIVESTKLDGGVKDVPIDDDYRKMSQMLIEFLETQVREGKMANPLPPIQAGIGGVSNAVLQGLKESSFEHLNVYSEVMQNSIISLIEAGKVDSASATSITMPGSMLQDFYSNFEKYKDKIVLRPMEISNSPEVIRRLGVIAINTVIEADIYGNMNSSYVGGNRLMNGVGGSTDFAGNAGLSIFITKSTAKDGKVSSIVPMVSHVDHSIKTAHVLITEQGIADMRGLDVNERAELIIENCAHPDFRAPLKDYLRKARVLSDYPAFPFSTEANDIFRAKYTQG
ncbi:MAG: acetyl-CoA hydrolase/transferase C-terminal domain-containing protein [Lachnospiraceae bacterium]|nr:acetyl-CoA hydrolase/transferase C-terminal domain-containing protein [Lachnospiraceae bacterium]